MTIFFDKAVGICKRSILILGLKCNNLFRKTGVKGRAPVIVSVTSFGQRIANAALAIESIAGGDVKPQNIILFLDEALRGTSLPAGIKRLEKRGLDVRYVPDYRSYKKFFFALETAAGSSLPLVTIDDDFIYPKWFLSGLLKAFQKDPESIYCYRARRIEFDGDTFKSYSTWKTADHLTPANHVFLTSGGGAIFPTTMIMALLQADDQFLHCCPTADDIWLNYISAKNGITTKLVLDRSIDFTPLETPNELRLWLDNERGGNDVQLLATYDSETLARLSSGEQ